MRKIIRLLYKGLWAMCFVIKNKWIDIIFRLRLFLNGVQFGSGVHSGGGGAVLRISKDAIVQIGRNVSFNAYDAVSWYCKCCITVKNNAFLKIGDNSGFNGSLIYASNKVIIGDNVKIGGGSRIIDSDFHPLDYLARRDSFSGTKTMPVAIEDDVFVGTNCIICKGVTIGSRSIVAAGSVVVKSIPSDEVWGGNPAKFIRKI